LDEDKSARNIIPDSSFAHSDLLYKPITAKNYTAAKIIFGIDALYINRTCIGFCIYFSIGV
jgi:hypothetical protein